jgi:hypothetical protein
MTEKFIGTDNKIIKMSAFTVYLDCEIVLDILHNGDIVLRGKIIGNDKPLADFLINNILSVNND